MNKLNNRLKNDDKYNYKLYSLKDITNDYV